MEEASVFRSQRYLFSDGNLKAGEEGCGGGGAGEGSGVGRPEKTWLRKGRGGTGEGDRREGREDRGLERGGGGGDGRGRDRTRPGSETPRGKFGKEPWEKERPEHEYGTAAADARAMGTWGSLSASGSKRAKSTPEGPKGGSRWCVGAGPTGSLRVPDPEQRYGGGGPTRGPPPRGFF